jgi:hypothetical protein
MPTGGGMPERPSWRKGTTRLHLRRAIRQSYAGVILGLKSYPLSPGVLGHCAPTVRSDLIYLEERFHGFPNQSR